MPNPCRIKKARISNSKYYFSTLDLSKGYWQIPLDEESKKITAFQSNRGLLQFIMMPFGLVNASTTFNRVMRILFYGKRNVETFVDDILIHTSEWEEHLKVLEDVLSILQSSGLTVRPTKCELGHHFIEKLGHTVGGGVTNKVASIISMKVPQFKKEVRSFLGLAGYYRQYIKNYASIASPLTDLTKKTALKVTNRHLTN